MHGQASRLPAPKSWPATQPRAAEWIAAGAIFWMIASCLQWKAGAFAVEFSSDPDESAHYITGLVIRDYIISIISGYFTWPLAYAEHYYSHYPKVAFGAWPPLFHVTVAFWSLIFSPAKISILLLMALITASIGASIYVLLRRQYPMVGAFAGGALFVALPLTQASAQTVMADSLVALLDFWAMIFTIRYLDRERTRDAVVFGMFAALSMATKANGVALLLVPALAILITRRFHVLRARGLYCAGAVVLVLGLSWQVVTYRINQRSQGAPQSPLADIFHWGLYYVRVLLSALGWGLAPFLVLGLAIFLIRLWRKQLDLTLACAFALLLSLWAFHSVIGSAFGLGEPRYALAALPPAILFMFAGFDWTVRRIPLPAAPLAARSAALGALAVAVFTLQTWAIPRKPYQGFDQPAYFLLSNGKFADGNFLVVSNSLGEGAFITEVAMHEQRPGHIVLRSSKFLSSSTWFGKNYQLRYRATAELRGFLDHAPIDAVILDTRTGQFRQTEAANQLREQVAQALIANPNWNFQDDYPKLPDQGPWIKLYTRVGARPLGEIRLDLRNTLDRDIIVHADGEPARRQGAGAH